MIRLVTQFDSIETRAAAATPTCASSSSCSCCCCLTTAITSSAYTTMNLRANTRRLEEETGSSPSPWPEILGFLTLPIAIGFGVLVAAYLGRIGDRAAVGLPVGFGVWLVLLLGLYRWAGSRRAWTPALGTVLLGGVAGALELVGGTVLVLTAGPVYLVVALLLSALAITLFKRHLLGGP